MAITYFNTDTQFLGKEFEQIVKKIFDENGFNTEVPSNIMNSFDLLAKYNNTYCYVEIKLYRSKLPKIDLLRTACSNLLSKKDKQNAKLILAVSSYITPSLKEEIFKDFGVIIWDIRTLFSLAFDFADTFYALEKILVKALQMPVDEYTIVDNDFKARIIPFLIQTQTNVKSKPLTEKGRELCKELNDIDPGRPEATLYENKCIEILKFLFDNESDLTLWEKQLSTDDGLNRFDLLCRILPYKNTFWTALSNDFHSRYIVFEFKNYTDPIKQGQIFTTEKYLFLTALRSVSFIITTQGADENAIKAAKGALKEAGKLIVILTNKDICDMLSLKDKGEEPSLVLQQRIDEMLITLNR